MDILSQYILTTLAELVVINDKNDFSVATELLLLASTMREDDYEKLKSILDDFVNDYGLFSSFSINSKNAEIVISDIFPKPPKGSYDVELIRHKLIRRTLLYKLYLTYLKEGGTHASYSLVNLKDSLNSNKDEIFRHVQYLIDEYYLEYPYADGGMCTAHLTNYGVKLCESRTELFSEFSGLNLSVIDKEATQEGSENTNTTTDGSEGNMNNHTYDLRSIWELIEAEYGINKRQFGKKINFVDEKFRREIIFRDVAQAFYLAKNGLNKPAVILSGGIVEELLRLYLKSHNIKPDKESFEKYVEACVDNKLLTSAISKLSDSVRHFRNLVHLQREKSKKDSLSKSSALGAVSTIFTLINDFEPYNQ